MHEAWLLECKGVMHAEDGESRFMHSALATGCLRCLEFRGFQYNDGLLVYHTVHTVLHSEQSFIISN